jgi:hypothetical protein
LAPKTDQFFRVLEFVERQAQIVTLEILAGLIGGILEQGSGRQKLLKNTMT